VEEGVIVPTYVPTEIMRADKLTKPFGGAMTKKLFRLRDFGDRDSRWSSEGVCRYQDRDVSGCVAELSQPTITSLTQSSDRLVSI
jgi:hypothetical protein